MIGRKGRPKSRVVLTAEQRKQMLPKESAQELKQTRHLLKIISEINQKQIDLSVQCLSQFPL